MIQAEDMNAVYFSATWCGPCKTYKPYAIPVLRELGFHVEEVDIDDTMVYAEQLEVKTVPTIVIVDSGGYGEIDRIVGAYPEGKLRERLQKILG